VRSEIEKHFKANSAESEVNDAIKSIVAAANNNGEAEEGESRRKSRSRQQQARS